MTQSLSPGAARGYMILRAERGRRSAYAELLMRRGRGCGHRDSVDRYATSRSNRPSVVLTMIVRNEAHVLERCLRSVKPMVDAWCIVDTGSTDGTQELVRRLLAGLPGRLLEMPWQDFAYNRTEALRASRRLGDYHFVVDADAELVIESDDVDALRRGWTADVYGVVEHLDQVSNPRPMILSTRCPFHYRGVIHESVVVPTQARQGGVLEGFHLVAHPDGARSKDPLKHAKDAATIEHVLVRNDEPDLAARYVFHLAQAYRGMNDLERALDGYRQRVSLGGDRQEIYVSLLWCAMLTTTLGQPLDHALSSLLHAIDLIPQRAEAYYYAAVASRDAGRMPSAHLFASSGLRLATPMRVPFEDRRALAWGLPIECYLAAAAVGHDDGAVANGERLLRRSDLPAWTRELVETTVTAGRAATQRQ
jgi:tetratricopeptide (TPR) repeat protein